VRRVEQIMGMPIAVDIRDPGVDPAAFDSAFDWLRFVDATFSTYKDDSEISRLNRGELDPEDVHPNVTEVLRRCEQLREETGGYFDAWAPLPGGVDPSGLVKGWSVDRAARLLEAFGARNYFLNAGGDIRVRGEAEPRRPWRVGIQHPLQRHKVAAVVEANDLAIATSGEYERGHHIVNPRTGQPPSGVLSVTVVGPDLATADAYATAAFAMGAAGPRWTARLRGYEAMTILADETVLSTGAFPVAVGDADPRFTFV
jgi:thiamine biosynthesis lipoprotein